MGAFCAQSDLDGPNRSMELKSKGEEHGISQKASEIGRIPTPLGPFLITNSMVVTWVVAICLIVLRKWPRGT